jgi:D-alanyl-D-alanine-carboxypeptidase/D-alanyl-D-alanine-endopeptidase
MKLAVWGALISLLLAWAPTRSPAADLAKPGLDGEWVGSYDGGRGFLIHYAVRISSGADGLRATSDTLEFDRFDAPFEDVTQRGEDVRLTARGTELKAVLDRQVTVLRGSIRNGASAPVPLLLTRRPAGAPPALPRPADRKRPSDSDIRKALIDRVDRDRQGVGLVVGIVDEKGARVVAYGKGAASDPRPVGGDTVFELGSVTKVFTAMALADMVRTGDVRLDDAAHGFAPPGLVVPNNRARPITLADLATHMSALPGLPANLRFKNLNDADPYGRQDFFRFVSAYELPRDPGSRWEYSNVGSTLLGDLLAHRAGMEFDDLLAARIFRPLGMTRSGVAFAAGTARLATPHDRYLHPVAPLALSGLQGSTMVRSTANDLLTFLEAVMGTADTPAKSDTDLMLSVRTPTGPGAFQAIGWMVNATPGGEVISHSGGTGGSNAYLAFNRTTRLGVVVLANAATNLGVYDIAQYVLTGKPAFTVTPQPPEPPEVALPASTLRRFAGRYRSPEDGVAEVWRDDGRLFIQYPGRASYELVPMSDSTFNLKGYDKQFAFLSDADGMVSRMVVQPDNKVAVRD